MLRQCRLHSRWRPRRRPCLACRGYPLPAAACSSWLLRAAIVMLLAGGLASRVLLREGGLMLRLNLSLGCCLLGDMQLRAGHCRGPCPRLPGRHPCPVHMLYICCCILQEGPVVQMGWRRGHLLVRPAHSCRGFLERLYVLLRHQVFLDCWRVGQAALHLVAPLLQRLYAASSTDPDCPPRNLVPVWCPAGIWLVILAALQQLQRPPVASTARRGGSLRPRLLAIALLRQSTSLAQGCHTSLHTVSCSMSQQRTKQGTAATAWPARTGVLAD